MVKTFNKTYADFMVKFNPEHQVIRCDGIDLDKEHFQIRVDQLTAHLINLGVRKGMGVGYSIINCGDNLPLFIAIARIGAYAVPQFQGIPAVAKSAMFKNAGVFLAVVDGSQADGLKTEADKVDADFKIAVIDNFRDYYSLNGECETDIDISDYIIDDPEEDLPLLIASSSGTTGIPKMVKMTQKTIGSEVTVVIEMVTKGRIEINKNSVVNVAFPLSTSVISIIIGTAFSGDTVIYSNDNTPLNFISNIEKWKCNYMCSPPAFYESILLLKDRHNFDLSSLQIVGAGMDFCSPALLSRLKTMFPNLKKYVNGYGLVETCNVFMHTNVDISGEEITGVSTLTLAESVENVIEVRDQDGNIVPDGETGELYIKGSNVVKGYVTQRDDLSGIYVDGWFRTGDIVRKESEKTVTLMGRKKYFIKRGGKSVSPIVVQNAINGTEGVYDSGVVGVPHPLFGEMIWAFVVRALGSETSLKDIKMQCRKILPYYMMPDQVTFIDVIPKKPGVGKVNFEKLKEMGKTELEKINFK